MTQNSKHYIDILQHQIEKKILKKYSNKFLFRINSIQITKNLCNISNEAVIYYEFGPFHSAKIDFKIEKDHDTFKKLIENLEKNILKIIDINMPKVIYKFMMLRI